MSEIEIEIIEQPDQPLLDFVKAQISQFNWQHWQNVVRQPLAVQHKSQAGEIIAAATGTTFGHWLMIDYLWVSQEARGQQLGSKLLNTIEQAAKQRGCNQVLLDTLDFQAQPFYLKYGYQVAWTQNNYPKIGCKYFMTKSLD